MVGAGLTGSSGARVTTRCTLGAGAAITDSTASCTAAPRGSAIGAGTGSLRGSARPTRGGSLAGGAPASASASRSRSSTGSGSGSPSDEPCRDASREAQHQVSLTRRFLLMDSEITQQMFSAQMGYNPSMTCTQGECPVTYVNWHEVVAYCNALSAAQQLEACCEPTGGSGNSTTYRPKTK